MNREEWENTYSERNAKAEMWGAGIAGLFFLIVLLLILSLWNPMVLYFIPLAILWVIQKRRNNRR